MNRLSIFAPTVVLALAVTACGEDEITLQLTDVADTSGDANTSDTSSDATDTSDIAADTDVPEQDIPEQDVPEQDTPPADVNADSTEETSADVAVDTGPGDPVFELEPGQCFILETGAVEISDGTMCGDFMGLAGINVDLVAADGPDFEGGFCDLGSGYANLAAVPTDASDCFWTSYIEGMEGLENHGLLVKNAEHTMTYVMHIVSNTYPAMIFSYAPLPE